MVNCCALLCVLVHRGVLLCVGASSHRTAWLIVVHCCVYWCVGVHCCVLPGNSCPKVVQEGIEV